MPKPRSWLALALLALIALPSAAADSRAIVVAQAADLSGPGADFGRDYTQGARIYFDHVNASGGINGRRIAYRTEDTGGITVRGVAAAQAFVKEGAGVLFGFTGDNTVEAVAREPAAKGIPQFAAVAGNTSLGPDDGVYYLRAGVAREIQTLVSHLAPLGIRSFAIAMADEHGREAAQALAAEAARQGAKVVGQMRMEIAGDGPARAAEAVAKAQPQAVIVVADTLAVAQFFRRYRSLDPGAFLCAPSLVNVRTLISAIGPRAARGIIVSQVVPDPSTVSDITREHRKLMDRYTDEPASQATLEGFIAAKALVQALRRAKEPAGLREAIKAEGRLDLGGYVLDFGKEKRASSFVELTVVSADGKLVR